EAGGEERRRAWRGDRTLTKPDERSNFELEEVSLACSGPRQRALRQLHGHGGASMEAGGAPGAQGGDRAHDEQLAGEKYRVDREPHEEGVRSEERRVGKEGRCGWRADG